MMVVKGLAGNDSPMHVGTTLAEAHAYYGDGVGADGVYFWDEANGEIGCDMVDDMYSYRMERTIDATADMQEKARQWLRAKVKAYIPGLVSNHSHDRANTVTKGDKVRVAKGRKFKVGTEGVVFWIGDTRYGVSVGVRTSDRKGTDGKWADVFFIARANLEVVNPPTYSLTDAQIEAICDNCATLGCYPTLYKNVEYSVKHALGIYEHRY